jgi:hypothetical protein
LDISPEHIAKLKEKLEDIKKQVKGHVNNFWKTVKQSVQKSLHPEMIETKTNLVKDLKAKISVSKIELEQHK